MSVVLAVWEQSAYWLTQSLRKALSESSNSLKDKYIQAYAPSVSKSVRMLTEAIEGENILLESESQVEKLRASLGLNNQYNHNLNQSDKSKNNPDCNDSKTKTNRKKRRPGERNPKRDAVGGGNA